MRAKEFITESKIVDLGYFGIKLNVAIDGATVDIRVLKGDRQIGYVYFERDGMDLVPEDLAIDEEYQRMRIATELYDYVKSLGFKIHASKDQTQAGKAFWKSRRGDVRVWEDENLTELFQPGKNWEWTFKGSEEAIAVFDMGDLEYLWIAAVNDKRNPTTWTISFRIRDQEDWDKTFGLTGTGNSTEVISTVIDITRAFLQLYGDKVLELRFSSEGDSRTSLYARMVKRLLPDWNMHSKKVGSETDFYLTNPKAYEKQVTERNNGTLWTGDELFRQIGDEGLTESQQTTLNNLYNGDFPERDDAFWDYVNQSEFDLPLAIQSITPQKLQIILLSQYRIEHLDELFDMMDEDQQETVERYTNDPNLSNSTIVMYDGRIIDGNHRALAAALKKVPVKYVDLSDLENNPDLDEDVSRRGFLGALGGLAMGAAGMDASAKTAPLKPKTKSPSQQVIQQAHKQQASKPANPTKDPQAEAMLYRTAKASGMKGSELAQFLAQTKHESWDHSRLQEKPVGDANQYFAKKYDPTLAPKTAKILGNKQRGDGAKYHGRGFIQLTGRENYQRAGQALGIDLINHPELASKPDIAAQIAVWYWNTRVKPKVRNFDDTVAVTKTINNAMFGLEDRLANFLDYKKRVS